MKKELFRKEAVEKITSPGDLNTYVKVLNPRIWLLLAGIAIAITGLIIFALSTGYPVWDLFFGSMGN
jgi:hypothetical protein